MPVGRHPGDVFRDCPECPEMVVVPAGQFRMGSPPGEAGRHDDEGPQHTVTIPAPFAGGKFEITFAEWDACVAAGGCRGHRPNDRGWGRGTRPVMNVNWDDARAYIQWLNGRVSVAVAAAGGAVVPGGVYRLLTEAEWEYAARAGTTTVYPWGDAIGRGNANCYHTYCRDDFANTAPVGSFRANGFGLHDMHGNVFEWVEDCWHSSYRGAPVGGEAWVTGGNCSWRVLRGGSCYNDPEFVRSASRSWNTSGIRSSFNGFRVARTL